MRLIEILQADYRAATYTNQSPSWSELFKLYLYSYSFRIVWRFRLAQKLREMKGILRGIARLLYWKNLRCGVDIDLNAEIGPGLRLAHPLGITIGDSVIIGRYAHILQNVTLGGNSGQKKNNVEGHQQTMPVLGDFARVGAGAVIAGPITLGAYVQVAANAVVIDDVPDYATVGGVPGKVLSRLEGPHGIGLAGVIS